MAFFLFYSALKFLSYTFSSREEKIEIKKDITEIPTKAKQAVKLLVGLFFLTLAISFISGLWVNVIFNDIKVTLVLAAVAGLIYAVFLFKKEDVGK